jgi:hypothetical protein
MRDKKKVFDLQHEEKKKAEALSPGHIGWGYHNQRRHIEEVEKAQDRMGNQYSQHVLQPQVEKHLQQFEKENFLEKEAKSRMDAANNYVSQQ